MIELVALKKNGQAIRFVCGSEDTARIGTGDSSGRGQVFEEKECDGIQLFSISSRECDGRGFNTVEAACLDKLVHRFTSLLTVIQTFFPSSRLRHEKILNTYLSLAHGGGRQDVCHSGKSLAHDIGVFFSDPGGSKSDLT